MQSIWGMKANIPPKSRESAYHHGNLRAALIAASREIIDQEGIEGFSLRAAARRAGVSQGAPAHHFASVTALLTEVALLAFDELGAFLEAAPHSSDPMEDLHAVARAYVEFAVSHVGLFRLMFREGLTDRSDPRHSSRSQNALRRISYAGANYYGITLSCQMDSVRYPELIGVWVNVHGLAHIAVEGALIYSLGDREMSSPDQFMDWLPSILQVNWPARRLQEL
jgi:AcrR family transcriptional regulator